MLAFKISVTCLLMGLLVMHFSILQRRRSMIRLSKMWNRASLAGVALSLVWML